MKDKVRDVNEIRITGVARSIRRITTKAGLPLTTFTVSCGKELIHCVCFSPLAEQITIERGDRVQVEGKARSTDWIDKDGQQRFSWQIVVLLVVKLDADRSQAQSRRSGRRAALPQQGRLFPVGRDCGDNHRYTGGPF
jgi:single-stranded DNA-binding protein